MHRTQQGLAGVLVQLQAKNESILKVEGQEPYGRMDCMDMDMEECSGEMVPCSEVESRAEIEAAASMAASQTAAAKMAWVAERVAERSQACQR